MSMYMEPAILVLADGTIYEGYSIGAAGDCVGELVFNTSMTGYQEILTDPSYAKQIVMFTTAHVGNTGCNSEDVESWKPWASGLVIRDCSLIASNYRSESSLPEWLKKQNIVAISGVDTRAITHRLRDKGAIAACISTHVDKPELALEKAKGFSGMQDSDLAKEASRKTPEDWQEGLGVWGDSPQPAEFEIVAYDFGIKHNILRILQNKGCKIRLVPANTPAETVLAMNPDGILLSNGPGDPGACTYAINATQAFLDKGIPLLGICLGFQILALACKAKTVKMKFGHHGSNHPVIETQDPKRVFITSQNHGFMVDETTLPEELMVTHRSLFDNSLQGIKHRQKPAIGFQGHPEASPGPREFEAIYDEFIKMMR